MCGLCTISADSALISNINKLRAPPPPEHSYKTQKISGEVHNDFVKLILNISYIIYVMDESPEETWEFF